MPVSGSIPACAGEPSPPLCGQATQSLYPRVCGGTRSKGVAYEQATGLSPRVRGNHAVLIQNHQIDGSIPACAGEPLVPEYQRPRGTVYPRVCGGTSLCILSVSWRSGLSPRVRGNPWYPNTNGLEARSIPACAGEPPSASSASPGARVYPRVCGGTGSRPRWPMRMTGLSPRVRGNRPKRRGHLQRVRSIPACAGEPSAAPSMLSRTAVYPRVCGGTRRLSTHRWSCRGLSPRVRGNPGLPPRCCPGRRSIPACAGEPRRSMSVQNRRRVYPRVCGGTTPRGRRPC